VRIIDDTQFSRGDFASPTMTIGSYDGLHLGHQKILDQVISRAKSRGGEALVLTFEPHPAQVFSPESKIPLITPYRKKMMLLEQLGVDVTINLPFTKDVYTMSAKEFVEEIVVKKIGPRAVIVGFNFTFGKGRKGNVEDLERLGKIYGIEVHVTPPFRLDNKVVSSTRIRALIMQGNIREANRMLGRHFFILAKVIHGHARGRKLGYPTANLERAEDLYPKAGVYAAYVTVDNETYRGAVNIGTKPTFGDEDFSIETFVFDYKGNLYGKELTVSFVDRLRDEQRFPSPEALVQQMEKDIERSKEILTES